MSKETIALMSFATYRAKWGFVEPDFDLFFDNNFGCNETEFEKWINSQRMFVKRFNTTGEYQKLEEIQLPEKKWNFFQFHFERVKETEFLTSNYPAGFFECISKDGEQIACFLPEQGGKYEYRISFFRKDGPTYHECYNSRREAITHLANRGFIHKDGILDEWEGTATWNRGVWINTWIAQSIRPMEGLKRDAHLPEIQRLFASELSTVQTM